MNYYISDIHFGHKNALSFDDRPFENVDEMARIMIDGWNKKSHGSYHIYGHIHSSDWEASRILYEFGGGRALNAGCMINHYVPCSLKELIENNDRFRRRIM